MEGEGEEKRERWENKGRERRMERVRKWGKRGKGWRLQWLGHFPATLLMLGEWGDAEHLGGQGGCGGQIIAFRLGGSIGSSLSDWARVFPGDSDLEVI